MEDQREALARIKLEGIPRCEDRISNLREELLRNARNTLAQNKECYAAQWILQNQDKNIADYEFVEMNDWSAGVHTFSIRRKDG